MDNISTIPVSRLGEASKEVCPICGKAGGTWSVDNTMVVHEHCLVEALEYAADMHQEELEFRTQHLV